VHVCVYVCALQDTNYTARRCIMQKKKSSSGLESSSTHRRTKAILGHDVSLMANKVLHYCIMQAAAGWRALWRSCCRLAPMSHSKGMLVHEYVHMIVLVKAIHT
jgi:hypothetical protein